MEQGNEYLIVNEEGYHINYIRFNYRYPVMHNLYALHCMFVNILKDSLVMTNLEALTQKYKQ